MAKYQVLRWRGIPAQIRVFEAGKRPVSYELPERFQQEIDRVAMKETLASTEEYLKQWQWSEKLEMKGSAEAVAAAVLKQLEAEL